MIALVAWLVAVAGLLAVDVALGLLLNAATHAGSFEVATRAWQRADAEAAAAVGFFRSVGAGRRGTRRRWVAAVSGEVCPGCGGPGGRWVEVVR